MIPEDQKEFFKGTAEKRLQEFRETVAKYRKSLRLLEKNKVEPVYIVAILSYWKNVSHCEDEKDVELTRTGDLRSVIHDAEKQFMEINRRSDVQGSYHVGLKVGELVFALPKKMWGKYKKRK